MKTPEFQRKNYTYKDYAEWDGQWELIDGVPYSMALSPSFTHQIIVGELYAALRPFFQNQGCAVVLAPFDVRLHEGFHYENAKYVVQPDLFVVCDKQKITEKCCDGPPDLTVEVLSPNTALKDRNEKYNLYQQFQVKEYWVVDPVHRTVEVYGWEDGLYKNREVFGEQDMLVSFLYPELKLNLSEVFRQLW